MTTLNWDEINREITACLGHAKRQNIRWRGETFIFIGTPNVEGAIATEDQFEHGTPSVAFLKPDGRIMRYGVEIGQIDEIEFGEIFDD